MQIHVSRDGQQLGPYSQQEVAALLRDGHLSKDDLAWCDGLPNWAPLQEVLDYTPQEPDSAPPSDGRRLAAFLIDGSVIFAIGNLTSFVPGLMWDLLLFGSSWAYFALMETSTRQATLGKLALGLVVTNLQGQRIDLRQATLRFFRKVIFAILAVFTFFGVGSEFGGLLTGVIAGGILIFAATAMEKSDFLRTKSVVLKRKRPAI